MLNEKDMKKFLMESKCKLKILSGHQNFTPVLEKWVKLTATRGGWKKAHEGCRVPNEVFQLFKTGYLYYFMTHESLCIFLSVDDIDYSDKSIGFYPVMTVSTIYDDVNIPELLGVSNTIEIRSFIDSSYSLIKDKLRNKTTMWDKKDKKNEIDCLLLDKIRSIILTEFKAGFVYPKTLSLIDLWNDYYPTCSNDELVEIVDNMLSHRELFPFLYPSNHVNVMQLPDDMDSLKYIN